MSDDNRSTVPLQPDDNQNKLLKAYAALEPDQQAWLVKYLDAGKINNIAGYADNRN
jgi:hypothetical protein